MAVEIERNKFNIACLDSLKKLAGKAQALLYQNCDGKLDSSDVYNSALSAYEILDEMKLELYRKAIVYLKAELKSDKKLAKERKEARIK